MKKQNHRIRSNYIYKLRKKEEERILECGTRIPKRPSIFDASSDFNRAIRNGKN